MSEWSPPPLETVRKCCDCDGEGGRLDRSDYPFRWRWCGPCHGLGWRSAASDRWHARQIVLERRSLTTT